MPVSADHTLIRALSGFSTSSKVFHSGNTISVWLRVTGGRRDSFISHSVPLNWSWEHIGLPPETDWLAEVKCTGASGKSGTRPSALSLLSDSTHCTNTIPHTKPWSDEVGCRSGTTYCNVHLTKTQIMCISFNQCHRLFAFSKCKIKPTRFSLWVTLSLPLISRSNLGVAWNESIMQTFLKPRITLICKSTY